LEGSLRSLRSLILVNIYWLPLALQDAALLAIAVPAELLHFAPANYRSTYALLVALVALINTIVPPLGGVLSDWQRRHGGTRKSLALAGAAVNVVGLALMPFSTSSVTLAAFMVLATIGLSISTAAYQAMLPESIARESWGIASGVRGASTLLGTVAGLAIGGTMDPNLVFVVTAALVALGALSLFSIHESNGAQVEEDRAHVRDRHDLIVVFVARSFITFGLTMLMTFVLYFLRDVLHVHNASFGTGAVGLAALLGAAISAIGAGHLSDRITRKYVVAASGIPMTLAALGFAIFPREQFLLGFALLFGLGYGAVISTGWALALDAIPQIRDVARDLGIWGLATHIPTIIAPLVGAAILARAGGSFDGYRILFVLAAVSFALGGASVLAVRDKPARTTSEATRA